MAHKSISKRQFDIIQRKRLEIDMEYEKKEFAQTIETYNPYSETWAVLLEVIESRLDYEAQNKAKPEFLGQCDHGE